MPVKRGDVIHALVPNVGGPGGKLRLDQVHRRIGTPVLTGLHLEPAGLRFEPDSVVPGRMPDLFAGSPLCIMGRYRGAAGGAVTLQAKGASGQPWSESVKASVTDNPALPWVWARG